MKVRALNIDHDYSINRVCYEVTLAVTNHIDQVRLPVIYWIAH